MISSASRKAAVISPSWGRGVKERLVGVEVEEEEVVKEEVEEVEEKEVVVWQKRFAEKAALDNSESWKARLCTAVHSLLPTRTCCLPTLTPLQTHIIVPTSLHSAHCTLTHLLPTYTHATANSHHSTTSPTPSSLHTHATAHLMIR